MRFWKNEDGATLIYVSAIILALVGAAGLALDSGRLFTLRHEVQKAADAAALAGAWQLDGTQAGSVRADAAARTAPVAPNDHKLGNSPGAVAIASSTFWRAIPNSDDAPLTLAAPPYDYIEVTTSAVAQNTMLMRVMGAAATTTITARAVARKGQARCQQTPLFMCLPGGASFDPAAWIGHQVLMRAGGGNNWTNGNWGLLDTPSGSQSTGALASMIAGVNGLPQCITTGISTKPGNVASLAPAFNVRFDIYENLPGKVNYRTTAGYPPAENVTKGKEHNCTAVGADTARLTRLGRDSDISNANRFGNGQWDCDAYWTLAHPNDGLAPTGCTSTGGMTRYEMYLHEIENSIIPDTTATASPAVAAPYGDDGNAIGDSTSNPNVCYTGGNVPATPMNASQRINDRRIFVVAGVDCLANPPSGNSNNVPVVHYLSMFITEPSITQGGQTQGDTYMEIVGHDSGGGGGLAPVQLREWVELVR